MAKDTERKRKLEEQAEHTPKRLKQSQADSANKANSRGNASPQVQIPRHDGLKKSTKNPTPAKKGTSADAQPDWCSEASDPKPRKNDVGTTEQESIASSNAPAPNAQNVMSKAALKKQRKDARRESLQTSEDLSIVSNADDDTSMVDTVTPKADAKSSKKVEQGLEAEAGALTRVRSKEDKNQRSREKKARRKAEREVKAGVKEDEQLSAPNEHGWWLSSPSAGRYINHDPIFVADENGDECLIAATIREVQLLHLDNSLISRTHIVPDGRAVQCFSLSAKYPDHVDIAYDNGAKIQWNWTTGATSDSTYPGQEAVVASTTAHVSDGVPESFYISHAQGSYNINGGRKLLYSTYRPIRSIQVTQNASFIICFGTTALIIGRRKEQTDTYVWLEMPMTVPPQCVDAKAILTMSKKNKALPAELVLAVGNADGKIHVYSDLASLFGSPHNATLPAPRILHWHREAVSTVKFSRDGNYLISGGKESVMVIWQLETGHKQFLPHLTAEIERIVVSPDGTRYAVQMGDNSIMVLSTSELKPVANFAGLQLPIQTETSLIDGVQMPITTAVLHPSDATQLLMTVPSTQPKTARDISTRPFLQTFDVRNSRHVSRQALSRNNVTDFNIGPEDMPILPPDVSQVAVGADGKWLATVDEWIVPGSDLEHAVAKTTALGPHDILALKDQQARRREVYLKFWKWDANQGIWTLSTRVDGPHDRAANADLGAGAGSVLRLKSDPISNTFATAGQDGAVKLWKPRIRMRHGVPVKEEDGSDFVEWACKKIIALPVTADVDDDPADSGIDMSDGPEDAPKTPAAAIMGLPSRTLSVTDAALAFSPDGSMIACSTTTTDEPMHPLVHFLDATTGAITATKTGIVPSDQEVKDLGFLDRYLIVLTYSSIRVWNLVDDSQHYTIALQGDVEDQQEAKLAINQTDGTFAVVSSIVNEEDTSEMLPHIAVYRPKHNEALFEADLECVPSALLAGNDVRGYTILFEDGTVRSLSSAVPTTRRLSLAFDAAEETVTEEEEEPTATTSALALLQEDAEIQTATAQLTLGGESEDDRPVVRPEQLSSIFDVGGIPPVRDMFHAVVGLYARKPRNAREMEMELA
ncbi:U3 small nucleolar RNA-associated protein 17, partial [Pseudocercospora fuligena]